MIQKINNKWVMKFSQSNCYKERQFKTEKEYNDKKFKSNHRNMKKITVNSENVEDLIFDFTGVKHKNLPVFSYNWKIDTKDVETIIKRIKYYTNRFTNWFFDYEKAFEIDEILKKYENNIVEGIICIRLRDLKRKEVIISFGQIDENNNFIDKKNIKYPFNHLIFLCGFKGIVDLIFNIENKTINPNCNQEKLEKYLKNRPLSVSISRKSREK